MSLKRKKDKHITILQSHQEKETKYSEVQWLPTDVHLIVTEFVFLIEVKKFFNNWSKKKKISKNIHTFFFHFNF